MLRTFANVVRLIDNYRYYRGQGINSKESWSLAINTLP